MRLIFYLFVFSQFFNAVTILADKAEKESFGSDLIQWEKVKETKTNESKIIDEIIWKSYNGDESYFQKKNQEELEVQNKEKFSNEKIYQSEKNLVEKITEVEPYLPLNNFLDHGKFQTSVRWKSSFEGGVSRGTGQQNPSFIVDYGISDSSLLSIYFAEADDDLYNLVGKQRINYNWQSIGVSFKKRLIDEDDFNFGSSIVTTLEYWRHSSGSENSKSIYNQRDDSLGKDKFENIVGSLSLPFSKNLNKKISINPLFVEINYRYGIIAKSIELIISIYRKIIALAGFFIVIGKGEIYLFR